MVRVCGANHLVNRTTAIPPIIDSSAPGNVKARLQRAKAEHQLQVLRYEEDEADEPDDRQEVGHD
jgi:hypothetical protein